MASRSVENSIRAYLHRLLEDGIDVRFGILFGSHANGRAGDWSDIDLVIVSPRFDGEKDRRDIDRLWISTLDVDERIEPVACGVDEWEHDDLRAIIEIARRTGTRIDVEEVA